MLATAYLAVMYAKNGKKIHIVLIFCFLAFGMIGHKRALIGFVPIILLISMLLFAWKQENRIKLATFLKPKILGNIAIACVGGMLVFYTVVRLNPTLNPEGRYGGSFDIDFVTNYVIDYNSHEGRDASLYIGRLSAPKYVWASVARNGLKGELIGLGAGIITASRFAEGSKDYLRDVIGLGYGARNGVWYLLLQVGLLGVFTYLGFIFHLMKKAGQQYLLIRDRSWQCLSIVCQLALIVYLFATLLYSKAMIMSYALLLPVMWLVGVLNTIEKPKEVFPHNL